MSYALYAVAALLVLQALANVGKPTMKPAGVVAIVIMNFTMATIIALAARRLS